MWYSYGIIPIPILNPFFIIIFNAAHVLDSKYEPKALRTSESQKFDDQVRRMMTPQWSITVIKTSMKSLIL